MTRLNSSFLQALLDQTCILQQISSPTFQESEKAAYLANKFVSEGLVDVHLDSAGNALGRLPGGNWKPLVISAHTDTVHPPAVPLTLKRTENRIYGPAIGDNSLGVAALLSLITLAREKRIFYPGDIWLVGNTGEEGLGDLRGMQAVVGRFGSTPSAYLVLEGMGLGQIYHRGLGVERYRITAQTSGGHSWVDYGKPSAIHHLASLVTRLAAIPIPHHPRTSLNVGMIQGGTSVNTIAAQASLELDLRSEDSGSLQSLALEVRRLVEEADQPGVTLRQDRIGLRPAGMIPVDHPLVRLAETSLLSEGVQPHLEIASTDANIPLSQGLAAICVGITHGVNAHTTAEFIETAPVRQGMGQLIRLINHIAEIA